MLAAPMSDELRLRAEAWLANDPDPDTVAELRALLDDADGLSARFGDRLPFGTAGIRGIIGAGPAAMNRLVVRQVSAGLARRLLAEAGARERGVVVGQDARNKSEDFADDAAAVFAAAGLRVHRFAGPTPTPLVAFAVRMLDAAAGVQVTASHNPATDNGYKVYWGDGGQITAPLDEQIAAEIDAAGEPWEVPLAQPGDPLLGVVPGEVRERYLDRTLAARIHPGGTDLRIAYTPLHGVAGDTVRALFARAGYPDLHVVAAQAEPDPAFPTVAFPNPEEPGALDLALALAADVGAGLLLANDPDGDRIAAAIPTASGWRALSGDEIGTLLADHVLTYGPGGDERLVATTVVSSRLLSRIAEDHGVGYAETLTGFKWLARLAADAEAGGRRMVLAYEQALGVMVGDLVRDKDGISAALGFADMTASLRARGLTVQDALDDLARRFGVHATAGRNLRLDGPDADELVRRTLERLRDDVREVAGTPVVAIADYDAGVRRGMDGSLDELGVPPTDLISLELADGSRLQARPSGTEPLLKFYVEVVQPVDGTVAEARARAQQRLDLLAGALLAAVS
jgi:phosphomannomutase